MNVSVDTSYVSKPNATLAELAERTHVGDVVDNDDTMRATVVAAGNCPEAFLT